MKKNTIRGNVIAAKSAPVETLRREHVANAVAKGCGGERMRWRMDAQANGSAGEWMRMKYARYRMRARQKGNCRAQPGAARCNEADPAVSRPRDRGLAVARASVGAIRFGDTRLACRGGQTRP